MNMMHRMLALMGMFTCLGIQAQMVEFQEDAYSLQAPDQIVSQVQQVADKVDFKGLYEVIAPKKAGLLVNPWNNFIVYGIDPKTGHPYIIISPEWFSMLTAEQQEFLLARCFVALNKEVSQTYNKVVPILFLVLYVLSLIGVVVLSRHPRFAGYNVWIKAAAPAVGVLIANVVFMRIGQTQVLNYFNRNYDKVVIDRTLAKTGNKEAAIQALEQLDAGIKKLVAQGEVTLKPHEHLFAQYAEYVKNK